MDAPERPAKRLAEDVGAIPRFGDPTSRGTRTELALRAMNVLLQRSRVLQRLILQELSVPVAKFDTLHALISLRGNAALPSELADNLGVSRATVTARLRELEADGLIERRDNQRDGRSQFVSATAAGIELWDTVAARWASLEVGLLSPISDKELEQVTHLLVACAETPRSTRRPQ